MIEYISLREVDNPFTFPGSLIPIRMNRVVRWNDLKGEALESTIKQWAANLGVTPDEMHTCLTLACVHVQLGRGFPPRVYIRRACREGLLHAELASWSRESQQRRLELNREQERRRLKKAKCRQKLGQ